MPDSGFATTQASFSKYISARDDVYFLEPVFIKVEDTIFLVPKYHLARAKRLNIDLDESSEDTPINLAEKHDVTESDFRALMKLVHPLDIPVRYELISLIEWEAILKLCDMWGLDDIRAFAIDSVTPLLNNKPVSKIMLGREYGQKEWFKEGCIDLVQRNTGPDVHEGNLLSMEITIRIYQLRELAGGRGAFDARRAVENKFQDMLQADTLARRLRTM
ncbi:hypothetical protein FA15DRAFT_672076 [Coprinopsis marcescibilis]|uniref:BTB domain-containing protein n=1 Tax=Coprinopsis marcescibilis TaxID=230819 RepID=A0A5C3KNL6_COPMA|nr:hypothetical protein FA15DRAFT_672076 [Coprinopsis marcescibilis]